MDDRAGVLDFAAELNRACRCITLDRNALRGALEADAAHAGLYARILDSRPHLFSESAVFVSPEQVERMRAILSAIEEVIALPAYRELVLGRAPEIARFDPGPLGVFLGYDFHLEPFEPRLIEINTNAGGALLCAVLRGAQLTCCPELRDGLTPTGAPQALEHTFLEMFRAEWRRQRGEAPLRSIAIVDDAPAQQYLHPEFLLFERLFREHGLEAAVADARDLELRDGRLWHGGLAIDLVYNRLTDFYLEAPEHEALRDAYVRGAVVLTPHPRAHALYADKRNLEVLSDAPQLDALGVPPALRSVLLAGIPRTVVVDPSQASELWARRRELFFKPAAGYGGKAAYRGDKLTKGAWAQVLSGRYVAQERVAPSERRLRVAEADVALKLDVRGYVYDGRVQLLAARLYQGQTTNFRTPGGGFAPVFCPTQLPRALRADCP